MGALMALLVTIASHAMEHVPRRGAEGLYRVACGAAGRGAGDDRADSRQFGIACDPNRRVFSTPLTSALSRLAKGSYHPISDKGIAFRRVLSWAGTLKIRGGVVGEGSCP